MSIILCIKKAEASTFVPKCSIGAIYNKRNKHRMLLRVGWSKMFVCMEQVVIVADRETGRYLTFGGDYQTIC